jgi:DNA-binding transcriptional LysR family regulator
LATINRANHASVEPVWGPDHEAVIRFCGQEAVFIASDLAEGRLVTALDQWAPTPVTGFFLYYPSRRQMRPALKAFVDFLRKERHGA